MLVAGSNDSVTWRLHEPDLIRRRYDDIWIVFQRSAGKTHFLNETSASILETLGCGAADLSGICIALAGESADSVSGPEQEFVGMHLRHLDALGLICRTTVARAQ